MDTVALTLGGLVRWLFTELGVVISQDHYLGSLRTREMPTIDTKTETLAMPKAVGS